MNIVAKDKRNMIKYMVEELERSADIKENQLKVYEKMMRDNKDVDESKCKGRD